MKKLQIICVLCFISITISAQTLFEVKKQRIFSLTEIGVYCLIGKAEIIGYQSVEPSDYRKKAKFQIRTMVGYYITEKLAAGIGIGGAKDLPLWPLFGELRYSILKKANSPFVSVSYGKIIKVDDGSIFEVGVGYRKKLGKKNFVTLRTSYNSTTWRGGAYMYDNNSISSADTRFSNLSFTVGFMF